MKDKTNNFLRMIGFVCSILLGSMFATLPIVHAADLNQPISADDKAKFDEILTPVSKVYNLIKYGASLIAVIALLFTGISYMFSGNDIRRRDQSKQTASFVVIGLFIIWAAPFVVNLLIG